MFWFSIIGEKDIMEAARVRYAISQAFSLVSSLCYLDEELETLDLINE